MLSECDIAWPQFASVFAIDPPDMALCDDIVLLDIMLFDDAIEFPDIAFFVQLWAIALCAVLMVSCAIEPPDIVLPCAKA